MDEAAFNRGPGRQLGFFERRRIRKVLYEDYFPKFEKIAMECATAFSKAKEIRPEGCVNPVKECVLQLARSPCKDFIKLFLRMHPNVIIGLARLPTFICCVLQYTESDVDIRHHGLAFPFRCFGDGLSDWELGWRFKHQCPPTLGLGVVTMNSAANNALNEFYVEALEKKAADAFASQGATTLEIFGQQYAEGLNEDAVNKTLKKFMRGSSSDIRWLENRYIKDARGNQATEALERLNTVSSVFFGQCQEAFKTFNVVPTNLAHFGQDFVLPAAGLEDLREQLSTYAEFLAQFDAVNFKQNHKDFLDCLTELYSELERYHQFGRDSLRSWYSDTNRPSSSEVFSKNAQEVNRTFQLLYDVIVSLTRFSADPPIVLADEIQSRIQSAHSIIEMTHDLDALNEDDETYEQIIQKINQQLTSFAANLKTGRHPNINYARIFEKIQTSIEPLVALGQLRFMPYDLMDLIDPSWKMPQSQEVANLRETTANTRLDWN